MGAIAELRALVSLDPAEYHAGAKRVVGVNGMMRRSMGDVSGGLSAMKGKAQASVYALTSLHNAGQGLALALKGDIVGGARMASMSLMQLGKSMLKSPAMLTVAAIGASVIILKGFSAALDKVIERNNKWFESYYKIRNRLNQLNGGDVKAQRAERGDKMDAQLAESGDVKGLQSLVEQSEADLRAALEKAKASGRDVVSEEVQAELSALDQRLSARRSMLEKAVDAEKKAAEELAEIAAKREGREVQYYAELARKALEAGTAVKGLEAIKLEEKAEAALKEKTDPATREIERLQEQSTSVNARTKGDTLDRGALAKVGGMFGGGRAGFEIESKALRVAEEQSRIQADILRLQSEIAETIRINRGDL